MIEAYRPTLFCLQQSTSKMQPEQQSLTVQPVPLQPSHVAQPNQTAAVLNTYHDGQSMVIGILLIIAGCLSILFNIIDLAIGTQDKFTQKHTDQGYTYHFPDDSLSHSSKGIVLHGVWCGIAVSISRLILMAFSSSLEAYHGHGESVRAFASLVRGSRDLG